MICGPARPYDPDMPSTTSLTQARDGTPILVRRWPATREPWATVVLVHGIAEHSGRYERVGEWLGTAGHDVVA
jgi:lysophospholipase